VFLDLPPIALVREILHGKGIDFGTVGKAWKRRDL